MESLLYLTPVLGLIGLAFMAYQWGWVSKQDAGNERMQWIAKNINDGAIAFLHAE